MTVLEFENMLSLMEYVLKNRKACHIYMHDQQAKHKALQQSRCTPGHYMHVRARTLWGE